MTQKNSPEKGTSEGVGHEFSDSSEDTPVANHNITTLPPLKMLLLERYDRSSNTDDHIQNYQSTMRLHGSTQPLMCIRFPITLQKFAKNSHNSLPSRRACLLDPSDLLRIWHILCAINSRRTKKGRKIWLSCSIRQGKKEKLCNYFHEFNLEKLDVGKCNDNIAMVTFIPIGPKIRTWLGDSTPSPLKTSMT